MLYRTFSNTGNMLVEHVSLFELTPLPADWIALIESDLPADFTTDTYTIQDGQLVPASPEVIAERTKARQVAEAAEEIAELRAYLTSTDYTAIKCGELGQPMAEAYPELHARRTTARARINLLQEGGEE